LNARIYALVALLLIAGAALRIEVDDVEEYSPDDEAVYVSSTAFLHEHGWSSYPGLVQKYVADRDAWLYPHPMRWGYFALSTLACSVATNCDARALAGLSTAAGIVSILLVFLIGRELLGAEVALIAAALTATSPLQLAMGRRALQDEVFCASILLTLWLACLVIKAGHGVGPRRLGLLAAAVASMTLTLAIKESFLPLYPAVLLFLVVLAPPPRLRSWRGIAPLVILPPALYALVTIALCGGVKRYFDLLHIVMTTASSINSPFARELSSGPFHRPLFDLVILSPIVMVLGIAGAARSGEDRALRALTAFATAALVILGLLSLKNVRYAIPVDPVARLLAASLIASLPRRPWLAVCVAGLIAATELRLFHEIFLVADVYDPLTDEMLRALHAIP
jgi:4-amino-4-deoxy-L-arabinose transferase-like glycosyltransferase